MAQIIDLKEKIAVKVTEAGKAKGLKDCMMHPLKAETLIKKGLFTKASKEQKEK